MPEFVKRQEFTKLIVVRHPFERLLSAYNNKLVNEKSGKAQFHKLAQHIRMTFGNKERQKGRMYEIVGRNNKFFYSMIRVF